MTHAARTLAVLAAALFLALGPLPAARADDGLEFTLEEVEEATKPPTKAEEKKAKSAPIAHALGELRWGMSKDDVLALLKKRIRSEYAARMKAEKDIVRQDVLHNEANEHFRRIRDGYVEFNGRKSGWDASAVAEEFVHGSNEAMLAVDDAHARDLYFFINGRLWKWYRELKPAAYGGADFDGVTELLKEQFGRSREREEPRSEHGAPYRMLSWADKTTRVSALRRGAETCLVFEENETLERLAMLREHATPRGGKKMAGALQGVIMSTAEREAWRDRQ